MERRVGNDVEFSPKTKVLLVVGGELKVVAEVAAYVDGVLDIVAIKGDGILADGTGEGVLQQAHLVVVDVDIGEDVLEHCVEDVARLNQLVDTLALLTEDNVFRRLGTLAEDVLGDGLVNGERQDELVVQGAHLHLVEHPILFLLLHRLQFLWGHVVDG